MTFEEFHQSFFRKHRRYPAYGEAYDGGFKEGRAAAQDNERLASTLAASVWCHAQRYPAWTLESIERVILKRLEERTR